MAAGEEIERATRDVLADILTVMGADTAAHWDTIAGRLADQMPEQYDGTTPDAISAQARGAERAQRQRQARRRDPQGRQGRRHPRRDRPPRHRQLAAAAQRVTNSTGVAGRSK